MEYEGDAPADGAIDTYQTASDGEPEKMSAKARAKTPVTTSSGAITGGD